MLLDVCYLLGSQHQWKLRS